MSMICVCFVMRALAGLIVRANFNIKRLQHLRDWCFALLRQDGVVFCIFTTGGGEEATG